MGRKVLQPAGKDEEGSCQLKPKNYKVPLEATVMKLACFAVTSTDLDGN